MASFMSETPNPRESKTLPRPKREPEESRYETMKRSREIVVRATDYELGDVVDSSGEEMKGVGYGQMLEHVEQSPECRTFEEMFWYRIANILKRHIRGGEGGPLPARLVFRTVLEDLVPIHSSWKDGVSKHGTCLSRIYRLGQ